MYKTKYFHRYLQVFTQIAMNNNPSSKRAGVVLEHLENSLRQSFVHSTPKPDTQASAIYTENISRKSDSGFTSTVQGPNTSSDDTGHTIMMGIADVKLPISLFISDISYY
jgi:hypothetical protein